MDRGSYRGIVSLSAYALHVLTVRARGRWIEGEPMQRCVAIINAQAGGADDPVLDEALAVLEAGTDLQVRRTHGDDELKSALRSARGGFAVTFGGDGSVHTVVSALDELGLFEEVELAIVPMGTGNDYVRTVGIDPDPVEAARQAVEYEAHPTDLVRDDAGRLIVNVVHVGLGAEANVRARPWKKVLGPVGYAVGAIGSGVFGKGVRATVKIDGERVAEGERIAQVAVGNGRHVGGGAPLLPDADPFDGFMDVAVSFAEPRWRRLGYAWRLRRGRHPMRDDVLYRRATTVSVNGDSMEVNIDGDLFDAQRLHVWRVEPGLLRLRCPGVVASIT